MDQPLLDQKFYQHSEDWDWEKIREIMTNRPFTTMKSFWHVISFVYVRLLL